MYLNLSSIEKKLTHFCQYSESSLGVLVNLNTFACYSLIFLLLADVPKKIFSFSFLGEHVLDGVIFYPMWLEDLL